MNQRKQSDRLSEREPKERRQGGGGWKRGAGKGGEVNTWKWRNLKEVKWRTDEWGEVCVCVCEHTYVASMTTPTPVGCRASVIATAICLVNLSWTGGQTWTRLNRTNNVQADREQLQHWPSSPRPGRSRCFPLAAEILAYLLSFSVLLLFTVLFSVVLWLLAVQQTAPRGQ